MLESFIVFIQTYLVLSFVVVLCQWVQPKKWFRLISVTASVLGIGLIFLIRIPNFFNKAIFSNGLAFVIFIAIICFLICLKWSKSNVGVCLVGSILGMTILQGGLLFYQTVQGIATHGHTLLERDSLLKLAGNLAGFLFILLWGWGIKKLVARMDQRHFLLFFSLVLGVFALQQLGKGLLWLYQKTIILDGFSGIFSLISILINHEVWFIYLGCVLFVPFCYWLSQKHKKEIDPSLSTAADKRKKIAAFRQNRRIILLFGILILVTLGSTTILKHKVTQEEQLSEPETYQVKKDQIVIPLTKVSDGNLHRYEYFTPSGTSVRFIVIEKSKNAYGVGLDACEICGASGYIQRGDDIVCKLCDVVMNKATIGFKGGCNPIPLEHQVEQKQLIINIRDLDEQEDMFK